jgi:hypothetical protein
VINAQITRASLHQGGSVKYSNKFLVTIISSITQREINSMLKVRTGNPILFNGVHSSIDDFNRLFRVHTVA